MKGQLNNSNKSPDQVFNEIWLETVKLNKIPDPPLYLIEAVINSLLPISGKKILESGCGTGKISLELTKLGAKCTLLDKSPTAIDIAKDIYSKAKLDAKFVLGDIFELPFPDGSFDIVWNAGVLEHFDENYTASAIKEMCRVCKADGKVVIYVPSARGLFYRLGKWIKEIRGTWVYGYERPILTLKHLCPPQWKCIKEYQIGVASQLSFLPLRGTRFIIKLINFLIENDENSYFFKFIFGGYLLVSVFKHGF